MPLSIRQIALLVVLLALGVVAWSAYYPRSKMIAAVGLPGDRANDAGRHCQSWYRDSVLGKVPVRTAMCNGPFRVGIGVLRYDERVGYDPLTRRVTHVHRTWEVEDSLGWSEAQDSVVSAIEGRGGKRIQCARVSPALGHIRTQLIWRFPGYDVRLLAYRGLSGQAVPDWRLQVDAFPQRTPDCGGPAVRPS